MILRLVIGARLRDVADGAGNDGALDPFPNKPLGVFVELTDGRELGDPVDLGDEGLELVPLPNGAVALSIILIVVEGIVEPVEADGLPNPLPD